MEPGDRDPTRPTCAGYLAIGFVVLLALLAICVLASIAVALAR